MFKTINRITCYTHTDRIVVTSQYNGVTFDSWEHFYQFPFYVEFFVLACNELHIEVRDKDGNIVKASGDITSR